MEAMRLNHNGKMRHITCVVIYYSEEGIAMTVLPRARVISIVAAAVRSTTETQHQTA